MCFHLNYKDYRLNIKPKNLFGEKKTITCYKVLYLRDKGGYSSICRSVYYPTSGVVRSNRTSKNITSFEKRELAIRFGIHVYTNLETAQKVANCSPRRVIIPVICEIDDFVAYNTAYQEAVFIKVRVHKRARNMNKHYSPPNLYKQY